MEETNYSHEELKEYFLNQIAKGVDSRTALIKTAQKERQGKDPYKQLRRILDDAVAVSAHGKGAARHGVMSAYWHEQPIMQIQKMLNNNGFALGQAIKKCQEAAKFTDPQQAINELYGAIIYVAAAIKYLEGVRDEK